MALALTFVGSWPPPLRDAGERVLAAICAELAGRLPDGTVNLKLVDDAEIASLNKQYNGNAYATDVLTYNYQEAGETPEGELADIVISGEMAARQAQEAGTELPDEIGLLVAHALLHVLGFDHHTAAERQQVDSLQRRILELAELNCREMPWNA